MLDLPDEETSESADATPGADGDTGDGDTAHRRRLKRFASRATALEGKPDTKLALLAKVVTELLLDGYNPMVFCRFIPTAEYVAEHLPKSFGAAYASTASPASSLPPNAKPGSGTPATKHGGQCWSRPTAYPKA